MCILIIILYTMLHVYYYYASPRLGILILSNMVLYHHLMSYRSPIPTHTDNTQQQYRHVYMYVLDSIAIGRMSAVDINPQITMYH